MAEGVSLDLANYQASALLALLEQPEQARSSVFESVRKRLRELAAVNHWPTERIPDIFTMPEPESVAINEATDIPDRGHVANQIIGDLESRVDDLGALLATATGELDEQIVLRELAEKQRDEARAELQVANTQHIGVVTTLEANVAQARRDREVLAEHVIEAEKALNEIGVERTVRLLMVPGIQAASGTSIAYRIRWLDEQRKATAAGATELQRLLAHARGDLAKAQADLRARPVDAARSGDFKGLTHEALDAAGVPAQPSTPTSSGHRMVDRIVWLAKRCGQVEQREREAKEAQRATEARCARTQGLLDTERESHERTMADLRTAETHNRGGLAATSVRTLVSPSRDTDKFASVARAASAGNAALPITLPTPNDLTRLRFDVAGAMYEVTGWHTLRYPAEIALTLTPEREDDNG